MERSKNENEETALAVAQAWLRDFEASDAYAKLPRSAQKCLDGAVRVFAHCFTHRWSDANATTRALNGMTAEDAIDVLTEQLPRRVAALAPAELIEGLVELFIWAAKTGRIKSRDVEYACREHRAIATTAMQDERKWAPGTEIVMRAARDGIDPEELDLIREHAVRRGLDPDFVGEFLPTGPVYLGDGRWLWPDPPVE